MMFHKLDALSQYKKSDTVTSLERDLSDSVKKNQLEVYYQPVINGFNGSVVGVEALLRWNHPKKGILQPGQFIPLAEGTGAIIPMGHFVLDTVCRQIKQWNDAACSNIYAAINVSVIQLIQADFLDTVKGVLSETRIDPKYLELEITESIFAEPMNKVIRVLDELKGLGIKITLDDFGTAYSSLYYLKSLPIDKIKIDRTFTADIDKNKKIEAIIYAMVVLSSKLNIEIVAEGVETYNQLNYLIGQGCELFQGFLFSKPLPRQEIDPIIKSAKIELHSDYSSFSI